MATIDWRKRNAAIEAALREYLASVPRGTVLSTKDLAAYVHEMLRLQNGAMSLDEKKTGTVLTKLAPWMGKQIATHDGEIFFTFGKQNQRWRWHGQA
jgi:hypothetical protein